MRAIKQIKPTYALWRILFSRCLQGQLHQGLGLLSKYILMLIIILLPLQQAFAAKNMGINNNRPVGIGYMELDFFYYENYAPSLRANKDGYLWIGRESRSQEEASERSVNTCLPTMDRNTLYPFWDSLKTHVDGQPAGAVLYEVQGSAPNRKMVVQWTDMYFADTDLPMGTFQAILYEGTNQIKYQYLDLRDARARGSNATIGIQGAQIWGPEGSEIPFVQVGCNQVNMIAPGQAITFTPFANDQGRWDYAVDTNALFEAIELYDLTPFVPSASPDDSQAYTNQAPTWEWKTNSKLNTYEVDVWEGDAWSGHSVYTQVVGDVGSFISPVELVHDKKYTARVRGSSDQGQSWSEWSDLSKTTVVDIQIPTAEVKMFLRTGIDVIRIDWGRSDVGSGVEKIQVQVATDAAFKNVIHEELMGRYATTATLSNLPQTGSLYARVDAIDLAGNHSGSTQSIALLDKPVVNLTPRYSQGSLSWSWEKDSRYVSFEVEAYTDDGNLVYGRIISPTTEASTNYSTHGKTVRARARGRISQNPLWGAWSDWSTPTIIDRGAPTVSLDAFIRTGPGRIAVDYSAMDDFSGVSQITLQISTDPNFGGWGALTYNLPVDATSFEIDGLPQGVALYARIKASDMMGNELNYSAIQTIVEVPTVTAAKRYTQEAPEWLWSKLPGFNSYEIEIIDLRSGITPVYSAVLGDVDSFIYTAGWVDGKYYKVRMRASKDNGNTWERWSREDGYTAVDMTKPVAQLGAFFIKEDGSAQINYAASDREGIQSVQLQIATDAGFTSVIFDELILSYGSTYNIPGLPQNNNLYARIHAVDYAENDSGYTPTLQIGLDTPRIQTPVNGIMAHTPTVAVSGKADANAHIQLYLNGEAVGARIPVDASGQFSGNVVLSVEGLNSITADVHSSFGSSPLSSAVRVNYAIPLPSATFVKPSSDAILAGSTDIEVSAADMLGVTKVEFYVDGTLLSTVEEAPYVARWNLSEQDNGAHTLKTVVTNTSGKQVSVERTVKVDVLPVIPPVPPTAYTGELGVVTPTMSYGTESIQITGRAVDRTTAQAVANTSLKLMLSVKGFERKINVVTNDAGEFSYKFIPQENDSGAYSVYVIHPNETTANAQSNALGSFTINRIKFSMNNYVLTAARGIPAQISVNATASAGAQGLRWVALDEDQPSGSLPPGITVEGGAGVDIAAGSTAPTAITFNATESAAETGTVILTAFATDSSTRVRGKLSVNYKLMQAQPGLFLGVTHLETGVQQDSSVTETVTLGNRGLVTASNVRAELKDESGNAAPAWLFLGSSGEVGSVEVGSNVALQVIAQPGAAVADGIYRFKLHVNADNDAGGALPITVSVMQSGFGGVQFDVADIYTATLDADGNPIPGVKGASIKLQNEAVLTEIYTLTTNAQGIALADELPPGIYLYRVSASEHTDISGRVRIRPGVTSNEHIFLNYEIISIEFGVTETTIDDVYDIVLEATYQTQVPAPVVLLEPLSINLAGLQVGEERTGQLTLTNYGLIQAENVELTLPETDDEFKYEFFADIPQTLLPKTRIVIPYRITALPGSQQSRAEIKDSLLPQTRASGDSCRSYAKETRVWYSFECINGDRTKVKHEGLFYKLTGDWCKSSNVITGGGIAWGWAGGWGGGGGGWSTPEAISMAPECTPVCPDGKCNEGSASGKGNR